MTARGARPITDVAVGVLIRADGAVLLADRPADKPYPGYWEFPGGKIEPGESIAGALTRELREELGIEIAPPLPWVTIEFDYPHAYVRLHFQRVFAWRGAPRARERQRFAFFALDPVVPDAGLPRPLLPAALPALRWLSLPPLYALSNIAALGRAHFLQQLDGQLARGLRLLAVREPALADEDVEVALIEVLARSHAAGARVLVSSRHQRRLWDLADGVHLTSADLLRAADGTSAEPAARPDVPWVAASVHDKGQLARAAALGCDFAVLAPVHASRTHPAAKPLGWRGFTRIAARTPMPLYALGGLSQADLDNARRAGAHGVASLSAVWQDVRNA